MKAVPVVISPSTFTLTHPWGDTMASCAPSYSIKPEYVLEMYQEEQITYIEAHRLLVAGCYSFDLEYWSLELIKTHDMKTSTILVDDIVSMPRRTSLN